MEICSILDLDWREVVIDPPASFPEPGKTTETASLDIDDLVQEVRSQHLQHLAIQCARGEFAADQVPIFILFRKLAEESRCNDNLSLFNYYIHQALSTADIIHSFALEILLKAVRVLLLMDGMDEVPNQDITLVLRKIRKFSVQCHHNRFVVTCRSTAQKLRLQGFTDVEIAPFTQVQIITFAQKWFVALSKTTAHLGREQSDQFIQKLDLPDNWQFRQLVATPLFLHLVCWVFQGQGKFPTKQAEFYKQGLDLLLGKWDEAKGVQRDDVYRFFLLPEKLSFLSQLAAVTFEQGQYLFEQRTIAQYIGDYLRNLPIVISIISDSLPLSNNRCCNATTMPINC
jgi:predicted NACHT family NTPase